MVVWRPFFAKVCLRGKKCFMKSRIKKSVLCVCIMLVSSVFLSGCIPVFSTFYLMKEIFSLASTEETVEASEDYIETTEYEYVEASNVETEDSVTTIANNKVLKQTIMVYMVGSDLESDAGAASIDISEMMDANVDTDMHNIVIYTGGASEWLIEGIDSEKNTTFLLSDGTFYNIDETPSRNMGDPDTLSDFINYCYSNFDSDLYSLILWDHGAGPVIGYGLDENYGDILELTELGEALSTSVGAFGRKLEFIGFDACLMSSLEVANILEPYANYMIASQETEPGWGWNYDFLSSLSEPGMYGSELGKEIVDSFMEYGDMYFYEYPRYYSDLTLSCMDLRKYSDVENALNECFREQYQYLSMETFPQMVRERERIKQFGSFTTNYNYSMIDTVQLANVISKNNSSAEKLVSAVQDMVVYERDNVENISGVSICYPYLSEEDYTESYISLQEQTGFAPEYSDFLKNFYSIANNESFEADWNITNAKTAAEPIEITKGNMTVNGSDITIELTEEQQKTFARATFLIVCNVTDAGIMPKEDGSEDAYTYIFVSKDTELDENGVLHAYYGNDVIYMYDTSEGTLPPVPLTYWEDNSSDKERRYLCQVVLNKPGDDFKITGAQLQIAVNEEYPDGIIRSAIDSESAFDYNCPDKQLLDINEYLTIAQTNYARYINRDEQGNILFLDTWERADWFAKVEIDTQDAGLKVVPLENPENYYCIFNVFDVNGNSTMSDLIPLVKK